MNFIREVVDIMHENETVDARKNLTKLGNEIKNFQYKIKSYIDNKYSEFLPQLSNNETYFQECETLLTETENLLDNIENETKHEIFVATEELKQCQEDVKELALGLKITFKILKIDDLLAQLDAAKSVNDQLTVMKIICDMKTIIYDPNDKIFSKLDCFQNIKIQYQIEYEMMLHNLKQKFESLVQLNEKIFQNTKSVTVKISKDDNQLHETVIALVNTKYNPKRFCDFLIENIFEPIVSKPVSLKFSDVTSPEFAELELSYSLKELGNDLRPDYKTVFKNIESVILCLGYMNISISDTECVFSNFGNFLKEKFLKLIIDECLNYAIPDTMDEMNNSTLVGDIQIFNTFLKEMLFLTDNDTELLHFAEKIGILFRNRFCTNILDNAVEIMRKDLHEKTLVVENTGDGEGLSSSLAIFPRCMISRSTLELINLMEKVIKQTVNVDEDVANRLFSTVSIILDRYLTEMPTYHAKLLLNIPQQTALFHNNCMYLAYWISKNHEKGIESFSTMVKSLQHLGSEQFLNQIKNQRVQLMEILKEFDLSNAISELGPGPLKVVRQCLRQLELLKNVWQTVLPDVVYDKTMGNLLNEFCNEIIRRIFFVEDIPTAIANGLVEILQTIIDKAPSVFEDSTLVLVNVKSWMKLTQLKMILGASMIEITEQWASGKGVLTLNYKPEEIKHLIRALFQNTSRRAAALNAIV